MARGIATCVSGLRIRALAGLGLAEQTVLHLGPTGDVGADVYAAMGSWERHLDAGHLDAPARQALFCALTGFNAAAGQAGFPDGSTGRASYKRHLLDPRGLERYAHLLGRLGATATLRAERALGPGSGGKELDLDVAMADDYARIGGCHSHA